MLQSVRSFFKQKIQRFVNKSERYHFIFGLILTFGVTISEVLKWKQRNFFIYNNATRDFWKHINVYDVAWSNGYGTDIYVYGPLFNFIFYPISLMPDWLGPFVWTFIEYIVFFYSVFALPDIFNQTTKKKMWLFLLPILLHNLMYYQYNVVVAAIFLISFTQFEKNNFFRAILLIGISAVTKIYGGFQFVLLLLHKKPIKNIFLYALPTMVILILIPIFHTGLQGLIETYTNWFKFLKTSKQSSELPWQSFFYIKWIFKNPPPHKEIYQSIIGIFIGILTLLSIKIKDDVEVRTALFAILTGWVILFSSAPEIITYLIALTGYLVWFFTKERNKIDKFLFWSNFFILVITPEDILFPRTWMNYIYFNLNLNLLLFSFTWLKMIWIVLMKIYQPNNSNDIKHINFVETSK